MLWIHSLDKNSAEDKKKHTLNFLSRYFVSDPSKEWSIHMRHIWRDIQKIWPNHRDYLERYSSAINLDTIDNELKEKILNSLLHSVPSREVIRLCYKFAPKGSPTSDEALAYMLSTVNHTLQNTLSKNNPQRFDSLITSDILFKALNFSNDFPPLGDPGFSNNQETDIVEQIEQAVNDRYILNSLFSEDISYPSKEIQKKERDLERIADSIRRYGALSGIPLNTDDPDEIYKTLLSFLEGLENDHFEWDIINEKINGIKHKIAVIEQERRDYEQQHQSSVPLVRPFGYVSKPIERFLAYGQDVANDLIKQSLLLIHEKVQSNQATTGKKLPHWFISEFEEWWNTKPTQTPHSHVRNPLFVMDDRLNEIQIFMPQQEVKGEDGLDEGGLIVYDETGIIFEQKIPLYYKDNENTRDLISPEKLIALNSPSPSYTIEMTSGSKFYSWSLPGFSNDTDYIWFDYESRRQIMSKEIPRNRFILLTNKTLKIYPETIILENGQFFGNWDGFNYFVIEPSLAGQSPISITHGEELRKKTHYLEVQVDPEIFDNNLLIDDQRVILGAPPKIGLTFDSENTLFETFISIHPYQPCSIEKTLFYRLNDICPLICYDTDPNVCHIDLSDPSFLGSTPWGRFTIRIRNSPLKIDVRIECLFLPNFTYKFSKPLYLPEKPTSSFVLKINSAYPIDFNTETDIQMQRNEQGLILKGKLISEIRGTLTCRINEKSVFSGKLEIPIPQLAWRFDDEVNKRIWPIQRGFQNYSDTQYFSFGSNLALTIFFPVSWEGIATVSMDPGGQYSICNIVNGRGKIGLAKFYDTLTSTNAESILFSLTVTDRNLKREIQCPLFAIKRWYVILSKPPIITNDASGNRIIDIEWIENYHEVNRSIIIWKQGKSEALATKVHEEKIPDTSNRIQIRKSGAILSSDIYYLHFFKVITTWDTSPVIFPGEVPNVYKFSIEVEEAEFLAEADTFFNREEYVEAILRYKKYEEKHPEKGAIWKQEILNKLIYPLDFYRSIKCFQQLLNEKQFLKETDYSFISQMLVNNLIRKPHLLDFPMTQWMFHLFQILIEIPSTTPKSIICHHLPHIEKAFESIEDLNDEQTERIKDNLKNLTTDCKNYS